MVQQVYNRLMYVLSLLIFLAAGCKKSDVFNHNPDAAIVIDRFLPAKGGVGTEVLVYGSNFTNNKKEVMVTLNGMPCEIVGVKEDNLLFRVPSRAGSGVITITIGGKSGSGNALFNYVYRKTVSTWAGNGAQGFVDKQYGPDASFYFYDRTGMTADTAGNLYIADCGNHCIRKIDTAGYVTTFSGYGHGEGYLNGAPGTARYDLPTDIDMDKNGNLYVADRWNWFVRKIAPDGSVTSLAAIADPAGIGVDKAIGNVYVASPSGGKVYQVTVDGTITELPVAFNYPSDVAVDDQGNVLVVDQGNGTIEKLAAGTWNKTTIAGTIGVTGFTDGPAGSAAFNNPVGITIDNGNVFIADYFNNSIRNVSGSGTYTFLGTTDAGHVDGDASIARFNNPSSIAFGKNGTMYVLDRGNGLIRKVTIE